MTKAMAAKPGTTATTAKSVKDVTAESPVLQDLPQRARMSCVKYASVPSIAADWVLELFDWKKFLFEKQFARGVVCSML